MARGVNLLDNIGTPATGDTALNTAETQIKANSGDGLILVPEGDWLCDSQVTLDSITGLTLQGMGYPSRIYTTGSNIPLMIDACTNVIVEGIRFSGAAVATSSANGVGLYIRNCTNVIIRNCIFENFGFTGIHLESTSGTHSGAIIEDCKFDGQVDAIPSTSSCDIYISGSCSNVKCRDNVHIADATTPVAIGVFAANNVNLVWNDILVDGCSFIPASGQSTSYTRFAVGGTDENPTGSYREGVFKTVNCTIIGTVQEGIKYKNLWRGEASHNYIQDTDTTPEAASLRGAIFFNATQEAIAVGNTIINAGTNAIRCQGLSSLVGGADGSGQNSFLFADNIAQGAAEEAYYVSDDAISVVIANNIAEGCKMGVRIEGDSSSHTVLNVVIQGGVYRKSTSRGIMVDNANHVSIIGAQCVEGDDFGILLSSVRGFVVQGCYSVNNGQVTGTGDGIRLTSCLEGLISGNKFGNVNGSTQRYGISFGTGCSQIEVLNNDLQNNSAGMNGNSGVTSLTIRNNPGWVTENQGAGTTALGVATVTHGLNYTPNLAEISVLFGADPGSYYVDTIGATTFAVHSTNDVAFSWAVRKI